MMDDELDRSGARQGERIPEITRYREILSKDPRSLVFASLAETYRKHGMSDRAIQVCMEGMRFHPDFVSGRVALGRAYFDQGEFEKARKEMEQVLSRHPDNLIALRTIAETDAREGRIHEALLNYRKILRFHPYSDEAASRIEQLRTRLDRETKARKEKAKAGTGIATKTMAAIYLQQGYIDEARDIFYKVLEQVPDDAQARKMLDDLAPSAGRARGKTDDIDEGGA